MKSSYYVEFRQIPRQSEFHVFRDTWSGAGHLMVRDTWHIVSGSRSATCHVQNESNMRLNGTHERHMATCDWVEIYVRWIRG